MIPTHAADKGIVVPCETRHCPNYLTVAPDTHVPTVWMCPQCEDAQLDQFYDALHRHNTTKEQHRES